MWKTLDANSAMSTWGWSNLWKQLARVNRTLAQSTGQRLQSCIDAGYWPSSYWNNYPLFVEPNDRWFFNMNLRNAKMKLTDFYNEVAKRTNTAKTSINVADTKCVLSEAFMVLSEMDPADLCDTLAKGLAQAQKKSASKQSIGGS
ncbi:MAG TPA: hypothetical protein VM260_21495 [Pirellula sp.]|nr:hypothetical protein [Pirellula sp.]